MYNILYGIRNLIQWFTIIWKDRNWDYYFILVLLHKKLRLMEKHIAEHHFHVGWERDVHKIKRCRLTLERLIKDEVYYQDKEWNAPGDPWSSEKRINFDLDYLFAQMRKHIRTWWD